ncbi:hypothetical protein [Massilia aerilata]|uniref:Uncharacterized protein n=1 Tax=Massilia aerilata TaxID=453817 RepID=A0ABW0RZE1_9BURK
MTIVKKLKSIKDAAVDTIGKVSDPASRAGVTLERVAKMAKAGVGNRAIASQLTDNSRTGQVYTTDHVEGFKMMFKDVQTKVGVTAAQTRTIIADQQGVKQGAAAKEPTKQEVGSRSVSSTLEPKAR